MRIESGLNASTTVAEVARLRASSASPSPGEFVDDESVRSRCDQRKSIKSAECRTEDARAPIDWRRTQIAWRGWRRRTRRTRRWRPLATTVRESIHPLAAQTESPRSRPAHRCSDRHHTGRVAHRPGGRLHGVRPGPRRPQRVDRARGCVPAPRGCDRASRSPGLCSSQRYAHGASNSRRRGAARAG